MMNASSYDVAFEARGGPAAGYSAIGPDAKVVEAASAGKDKVTHNSFGMRESSWELRLK
jgi:hypothetical protein